MEPTSFISDLPWNVDCDGIDDDDDDGVDCDDDDDDVDDDDDDDDDVDIFYLGPALEC